MRALGIRDKAVRQRGLFIQGGRRHARKRKAGGQTAALGSCLEDRRVLLARILIPL